MLCAAVKYIQDNQCSQTLSSKGLGHVPVIRIDSLAHAHAMGYYCQLRALDLTPSAAYHGSILISEG